MRPSPLQGDVAGRPHVTGLKRPLRVIAVSSRLDAGRSEDPYVTSIVVGDDRFGLHLVWDDHAHQAFHSVMGTGWNAVDDLGGEYHGSPVGGGSGDGQNDLDLGRPPCL